MILANQMVWLDLSRLFWKKLINQPFSHLKVTIKASNKTKSTVQSVTEQFRVSVTNNFVSRI